MDRLDTVRAQRLLEEIRTVRVLVVGDLMLDVYLRGGASRISPEAPVPVVRVDQESNAPGGAANVAANLVALGAEVVLVGVVGQDGAGDALRRTLGAAGIEGHGLVAANGRPTTVKTRVLVGHQQVARYDREADDDLGLEHVGTLCERIEHLAQGVAAIALEDYDKGVLIPPVIEAALDAARRRDVPVVVDPKDRHFFDYRGATVFKPNLPELARALRAPVLPDDPDWMARTRKHMQTENLLLTLGAGGMALSTEEGTHLRIPAVARAVYDVSGAGDTVTAVLAAALGAGSTVEEAAMLATHAAGVEVGKPGAATVAAAEILESVARLAAE